MERLYIDHNSKLHKVMTLTGAISPINELLVHFHNHQRKSPTFDLRANSNALSDLQNLDSPIVRYYRSRPPLSPIQNFEILSPLKSPTVFKTLVKVEEDVLVMDGILVGPATGGRIRSFSSTSKYSGSSSSGGKSFYKREICRSWEDSGSCPYGAKCQFAHGKEELRPTQLSNKSKLEMCKSYSSGSSSYGSKCRFIRHQNNSPASTTDSPLSATSSIPQTVAPCELEQSVNHGESDSAATQAVSPIKPQNAINNFKSSNTTTFGTTDWSPLDDGIEVALPDSTSPHKALSRKDIDAYINSVLYGSNRTMTLPVFAEICPR